MLEACSTQTSDALQGAPQDVQLAANAVQAMRDLIDRMQIKLSFEKTRNEALNFEIARLKRWRFGTASESLDSTAQAVLFDAILADTAIEDRAALGEVKPPPAAPAPKRQIVRLALPAGLPRVDRQREIEATHCACGEALKRIGQDICVQLDCVPAQFFVLRHIRGKCACACCRHRPGRADAGTDDRQGHPGSRAAGAGGGGQARRSSAAVPAD